MQTIESNATLVDKMTSNGSFRDDRIRVAFEKVDRGDFFPDHSNSGLYDNTPIKFENFHQVIYCSFIICAYQMQMKSQPGIYSNVMHNFKLFKRKAPEKRADLNRFSKRRLSFLNVGSGTGYLQALMEYASCMEEDCEPGAVQIHSYGNREEEKCSHGIDIDPTLIDHARNWYANYWNIHVLPIDMFLVISMANVSSAWQVPTPPPEFFCCNAVNINSARNITYDRYSTVTYHPVAC
jgi:hypothetical protein